MCVVAIFLDNSTLIFCKIYKGVAFINMLFSIGSSVYVSTTQIKPNIRGYFFTVSTTTNTMRGFYHDK